MRIGTGRRRIARVILWGAGLGAVVALPFAGPLAA
jgi:hypothetical protein